MTNSTLLKTIFGDTGFFHSNAVESRRRFHGALAVSNDDNCVFELMSRTMFAKRSTFASSNGASTSSAHKTDWPVAEQSIQQRQPASASLRPTAAHILQFFARRCPRFTRPASCFPALQAAESPCPRRTGERMRCVKPVLLASNAS